MIALSSATTEITFAFPSLLTRTYMDDRSWASPSLHKARAVHILWECLSLSRDVAQPNVPTDAAQRRLGWPVGRNTPYDQSVFARHIAVRAAVLKMRYG